MIRLISHTLISLVILFLIHACGSSEKQITDSYPALPTYKFSREINLDNQKLQPIRLSYYRDTLYVICNKLSDIILYTPTIEHARTIRLDKPSNTQPVSFIPTDSFIYICDYFNHRIVTYNHEGEFLQFFNKHPDGTTPLNPLSIDYYGGVLYVGDTKQKKILAISMTDAGVITEKGELILSIPSDSAESIGFPSAIMVTYDGRLLVGDAESGKIRAYTCDGGFIYAFDTVTTEKPFRPGGFALDNIKDPEVQDSSSFDPSGIRNMGRIHIADPNNGLIHMFSPLGRYLGSYGGENLTQPSDIAIDNKTRTIYISDPKTSKIHVFGFGDK